MKRLRHDVNFLTSLGLLVAAGLTAVTGFIADVWDLNDFWYHTVAGYVMGALAIGHVLLNWRTLTGYARFRLRRSARPAGGRSRSPEEEPAGRARELSPGRGTSQRTGADASGVSALALRAAFSRRGLLGASVGGVAGWLLGRGLRPAPQIPAGSDVGVIYHQWSKPGIIDVLGTVENWGGQPPLYKDYPDARRVALPGPRLDGAMPLDLAIAKRRSVRDYAAEPLTLDQFSRVLFLTGGINTDDWGHLHRTAPSSGALYPIEIYPVVHNVAGLEQGVYHYGYERHELRLIRPGDLRARVVEQGIGQEFLGQCAAVLFLTQVMQRMRFKYQDRSYRYGLLEAGHLGENLYLAASAAGLGACGVGAFMDDDMNAMLGVDGVEEAVVYMLAVGPRRTIA
jgi:SagB-type dehydrogenase family enzyme